MATGCMLLRKMERDLHDTATTADPERLEAGAYDLFAPNVRIATAIGERPVRLSDILPLWRAEVEAWTPQGYDITNVVDAGDAVAYEYRWSAKHTGRLQLADGRVLEPTGVIVEDQVAVFARWDGSRITYIQSCFSRYAEIVESLATGAPEAIHAPLAVSAA